MCNYQGYQFGASYLDSVCIDGYLWDADSCDEPGGPLYDGGEIPCPECNHEAWRNYYKDDCVSAGHEAAMYGAPRQDNPYLKSRGLEMAYEADRPYFASWWGLGWEDGQEERGQS